jgi:hypothetical protein
MVACKTGKNAKRFLLALGLALLLPGMAGAAGFGPVDDSLWGRLADPEALFARIWDDLTDLWTSGASIDPNGEGPDGAGSCVGPDCGASIDPNG